MVEKMNTVSIRFIFFAANQAGDITNDNLYKSRQYVSQCLEHCGFGAVREEEDSRFSNEFAFPSIDEFSANVLIINYTWTLPLSHGDLHTFIDEVSHYQEEYNQRYTPIHLDIEMVFRNT